MAAVGGDQGPNPCPWDARYIYLQEWLIFMGDVVVNILYMDAMMCKFWSPAKYNLPFLKRSQLEKIHGKKTNFAPKTTYF